MRRDVITHIVKRKPFNNINFLNITKKLKVTKFIYYLLLRDGPIFRFGLSILSVKGFLGTHPSTPNPFNKLTKTRPPRNTMMPLV